MDLMYIKKEIVWDATLGTEKVVEDMELEYH